MSNRRRLWQRRKPKPGRLICPDCLAGRHPNAPHCAFCGALLDDRGEHPAPMCEQARTIYQAAWN